MGRLGGGQKHGDGGEYGGQSRQKRETLAHLGPGENIYECKERLSWEVCKEMGHEQLMLDENEKTSRNARGVFACCAETSGILWCCFLLWTPPIGKG